MLATLPTVLAICVASRFIENGSILYDWNTRSLVLVTSFLLLLFLFTLQPSWLPGVPRPSSCMLITLLVTVPMYGPLLVPIPGVQGGLYELGYRPWPVLLALTVAWITLRAVRGFDARWTILVALALLAALLEQARHALDLGASLALALLRLGAQPLELGDARLDLPCAARLDRGAIEHLGRGRQTTGEQRPRLLDHLSARLLRGTQALAGLPAPARSCR